VEYHDSVKRLLYSVLSHSHAGSTLAKPWARHLVSFLEAKLAVCKEYGSDEPYAVQIILAPEKGVKMREGTM
jgi:hypothetical protein